MIDSIPKIAHCFWYHPQGLPYLRYLSVASFALLNPEYELIFYSPTAPLPTGRVFNTHEQGSQLVTRDCTELLLKLNNVKHQYVDTTNRSFSPSLVKTAVHFTDLFRLELLSTVGGYWMDSDIIFTRPLVHSILTNPEFGDANTVHVISSLGPICPYASHRIGFMGAGQNNKFFAALYNAAITKSNSGEYQVYGASLYQSLYPTLESLYSTHQNCTFIMLPTSTIYGIDLSAFTSYRINLETILSSRVFLGVHWYGGGDHLTSIYDKVSSFDPATQRLFSIFDKPNLLEKLFLFAESLALPYL